MTPISITKEDKISQFKKFETRNCLFNKTQVPCHGIQGLQDYEIIKKELK